MEMSVQHAWIPRQYSDALFSQSEEYSPRRSPREHPLHPPRRFSLTTLQSVFIAGQFGTYALQALGKP